MSKQIKRIRVVDFFCGAGGFSEGFRQQGFEIVMGIDHWQPAIDTHNLNHGLKDTVKDVLDFWSDDTSDVKEIDQIPNTEIIVGSPSCTTFSMSNKAGKADKASGIRLIEAYLRVVAVKKHQRGSVLQAWYMENVPKSRNHIKDEYTFDDLNLGNWAKKNKKDPKGVALRVNGAVFNAGDYGAPQERNRFIAGEYVRTGDFVMPRKTHLPHDHVKSSELRSKMPRPNRVRSNKNWSDPNYPRLVLPMHKITDHFYDTGLYKIEWEKAEHLKVNHPFMGKMSFPENENRTSRTITATRSATTREAMIYKSERDRKGDGEYRSPTIREIASLMGFPYVYQFIGSEGIKWKLVGNSVCPHMSAALAKALRKELGMSEIKLSEIDFTQMKKNHNKVNNLNTFKENAFNRPKKRQPNAKFRRHPIKLGNITVDLMNFHPEQTDIVAQGWHVAAFFGTGKDHGLKVLSLNDIEKIENYLDNHLKKAEKFKKDIEADICTTDNLQTLFENDLSLKNRHNPINIVKRLGTLIHSYSGYKEEAKIDGFPKTNIPVGQLMAMYGLLTLLKSNGQNKGLARSAVREVEVVTQYENVPAAV